MKQLGNVEMAVALKLLSHANGTILGCYGSSLWEVDLKHNTKFQRIISEDITHIKYLKNTLHSGVYVCNSTHLRVLDGPNILSCSQSSIFTGEFDSGFQKLAISRFHQKHAKYSIGSFDLLSQQQQIIKLFDESIGAMVYNDRQSAQEVFLEYNGEVCDLDLQKGKITVVQPGRLLSDSNLIYIVQDNEVTALNRQSKMKVFDAETKGTPFKIQTFMNDVIVATPLVLSFYDARKLTRSMMQINLTGIEDFLYEPNISRLFASTSQHLSVFRI